MTHPSGREDALRGGSRPTARVCWRHWPVFGWLLIGALLAGACFDFKPSFCQGECCQGGCSASPENGADTSGGSAGQNSGLGAELPDAARSAGAGGVAGTPAVGMVSAAGAQAGSASLPPDSGADAGEPIRVDPCGPLVAAKPAQICIGSDCLALDCNQREALSLWLDPTGLPVSGQELQTWPDRSGLGNDARRQLEDPLYPLLVQDEARQVADAALRRSVVLAGNWLSLPQPPGNPALRFGTREFLLLVAASVPATQSNETYLYFANDGLGQLRLLLEPTCGGVLLGDRPGAPNAPFYLTGASVGLYDDQPRLYGMRRRAANEIEVRINGSVDRRIECVDPALDVDADDNAFAALGTASTLFTASSSRARLSAVAAFRGHLADDEVTAIEQFLCSALGVCSPVAPAPNPPIAPECEPNAPGLTSCFDDE